MVRIARHLALDILRRAPTERRGWVAADADGVLARICTADDPARCAAWLVGARPDEAAPQVPLALVVDMHEKGRLVVEAWRHEHGRWRREESEIVEDAA